MRNRTELNWKIFHISVIMVCMRKVSAHLCSCVWPAGEVLPCAWLCGRHQRSLPQFGSAGAAAVPRRRAGGESGACVRSARRWFLRHRRRSSAAGIRPSSREILPAKLTLVYSKRRCHSPYRFRQRPGYRLNAYIHTCTPTHRYRRIYTLVGVHIVIQAQYSDQNQRLQLKIHYCKHRISVQTLRLIWEIHSQIMITGPKQWISLEIGMCVCVISDTSRIRSVSLCKQKCKTLHRILLWCFTIYYSFRIMCLFICVFRYLSLLYPLLVLYIL